MKHVKFRTPSKGDAFSWTLALYSHVSEEGDMVDQHKNIMGVLSQNPDLSAKTGVPSYFKKPPANACVPWRFTDDLSKSGRKKNVDHWHGYIPGMTSGVRTVGYHSKYPHPILWESLTLLSFLRHGVDSTVLSP